jgi:hypothetical protein
LAFFGFAGAFVAAGLVAAGVLPTFFVATSGLAIDGVVPFLAGALGLALPGLVAVTTSNLATFFVETTGTSFGVSTL